MHAGEIFTTPEKSKEFLDSLNYDEFKKWVSFVNGIERGVPTGERGKVSGSIVSSENGLMGTEVEYRPPHTSYRNQLLEMAFNKSKAIEDPTMSGLTLGLAINAIHYFEDGNGRTGRMVFALLSKGYDGSDKAKTYYSKLLENTKGRGVINPNPATSGIDNTIRGEMLAIAKQKCGYEEAFEGARMPTYIFDAYPDAMAGEYSPEELAVSGEIDVQGRQLLYNTLESGGVEMISLMKTFRPERIKPFVRTGSDGKHTFVDGSEFLPTLTTEEITKWWQNSEQSIFNYVRRMLNVADRPDAQEILNHYAQDQSISENTRPSDV